MKNLDFDVDIDFADRDIALEKLAHIDAGIFRDGEIIRHNSGVYFQEIPVNPLTNVSNIDYNKAEDLGFFKVDFLNVNVYEDIKDEEHLIEMMVDPDWDLLTSSDVVEQLFHIGNHYWLVNQLKPISIDQLAMLLAIIRPSKRYLSNCNWDTIANEVWIKPTDNSYHFKHSHAVSYAMVIVVQMNLISSQSDFRIS